MDSVDGEGKSEEDFFTYLSYSERRGAHKVLSSLYYIVDPGGVDPLDSCQSLLLVFFFFSRLYDCYTILSCLRRFDRFELQIIRIFCSFFFFFFSYSIACGCYGRSSLEAKVSRKLGDDSCGSTSAACCFSLLRYFVPSHTPRVFFRGRCGSFAKIIKSLSLETYTRRLVSAVDLTPVRSNYSSLLEGTFGDWRNVNLVISTTS